MVAPPHVPDYGGGSLINLAAELERRLTGTAPGVGLHPDIAAAIPDAGTYLVVVCDGLGSAQLTSTLAAHRAADIDTVFPSTTTVALSSFATALPPSQHGLLGYELWLPEADAVVRTIKWTTLWGEGVDVDTARLLPAGNLWERLLAAGVEPVTVQPASFRDTPLTHLLYRGCRFEDFADDAAAVEAALVLSRASPRLVMLYLPHADFAAHVFGQESDEYTAAISELEWIWEHLAAGLPPGACLIGTADHGHLDFPAERRVELDGADHHGRAFYGDGRVMFVRGEGASVADHLPATWLAVEEMVEWWGPPPRHHQFWRRAPNGVLVADEDFILLHRFSDRRLIGGHGGLTSAEMRVPLLVVGGS